MYATPTFMNEALRFATIKMSLRKDSNDSNSISLVIYLVWRHALVVRPCLLTIRHFLLTFVSQTTHVKQ